jgi:hypothetical protein
MKLRYPKYADLTDEELEIEAKKLLASMRGQFILSQALTLAIEHIEERPVNEQEPSNQADMELLTLLFPLFSSTYRFAKMEKALR